jgi:NTE family protein
LLSLIANKIPELISMKNNATFFLLLIAIIFNSSVIAQEIERKELTRPKIGLVLSGGGAKGLAHVGVLKVLEELDLKPDYITGTSMGAVVGGLYSIGYSAHELDSLVDVIDWYSAFSDKLSFEQIGFNVKDDYTDYMLNLSGNSFKEIKLPLGMVHGQIISELLSELTWRSIGIDSFDDFPIPFRCIAADIISGKAVVFDSGSLAQAIRASMAIPSAFTPIVLDSMLLVDGGVINNFPVQECIDMGADIIIGVYVGSDENATADDLNTMVKIMSRSASFLGSVNAKEQINNLNIKIIPDLKGASVESFGISEEIVQIGEDAARQNDVYIQLSALSHSLKLHSGKQTLEKSTTKQDIAINKIYVEGVKHVKKEFVVGMSQIEENSLVNIEIIDNALKRLYGTMIFDKIEYRFVKNGDSYNLVFDVIEKDLIKVNASIYYDNYFSAGLLINTSYKHLLVNSSRLDLVLDISQYPRAKLSYNIYGGKRKRLFYTLSMKAQSIVIPNFYEFPNSLIVSMGQFRNNQLNFSSGVGLSPTKNSSLEFKASHVRNYFHLEGGLEDLYSIEYVSSNNFALEGSFKINTLNHPVFPTKGTRLDITYKMILKPVSSYTTADGMFKQISAANDLIMIDYKYYLRIARRFSIIPQFTLQITFLSLGLACKLSSSKIGI